MSYDPKVETDYLRSLIPEGSSVWANVDHVTPNLTRYVNLFAVNERRQIVRITHSIAVVTGYTYDRKREAIKTNNDCGSIVGALAYKLYGNARSLVSLRLN